MKHKGPFIIDNRMSGIGAALIAHDHIWHPGPTRSTIFPLPSSPHCAPITTKRRHFFLQPNHPLHLCDSSQKKELLTSLRSRLRGRGYACEGRFPLCQARPVDQLKTMLASFLLFFNLLIFILTHCRPCVIACKIVL